MAAVSAFLRALEFIEELLGGVLLIAAVSLVVLQIVLRTVFNFGVSGLYETATFCMIWSVFFTAGVGIRRNVHVRVDILLRLVPAGIALGLEIAICLLMMGVSVALAASGWLLVEESLIFGDSTLGRIRIPMWIPQLIMPIGGFLMLVHSTARLVGVIRGTVRPVSDETEAGLPSA
jgi:C4-dicarboxylate transporter, DctQ subunit